MVIGQLIHFDRYMFQEAYPYGYPYNEYRSTEEAFLMTRCGSAWGAWRVWYSPESDSYVVARCKEGTKRVMVSEDREWMYERQLDGAYKLKSWVEDDDDE
jgi:hypothetical protein